MCRGSLGAGTSSLWRLRSGALDHTPISKLNFTFVAFEDCMNIDEQGSGVSLILSWETDSEDGLAMAATFHPLPRMSSFDIASGYSSHHFA